MLYHLFYALRHEISGLNVVRYITFRTAVASLTDAFVWDGGASLYATHDGGATWTTVTPNLSLADSLAQLQFVDASTGFAAAAGADGVSSLYRTSDGGATWTQLGQ